jgi:hypothetical protein
MEFGWNLGWCDDDAWNLGGIWEAVMEFAWNLHGIRVEFGMV